MAQSKVDVVIVGAGAAGGVVASELAEAGLQVVLLERGPAIQVESYIRHDELAASLGGPPHPDYRSPERRHPREIRTAFEGAFRTVHPENGAYAWMGGVVGGGQINYAGLMWRRPPQDFRMRSEYGSVPGTTLEDWPVSYDDLEPCFEKAEYELGVSGEAGVNPFEGKRRKPYPLEPVELQAGDLHVRKVASAMGFHPFTVPLGILTQAYRDRPACIQHPCCNGYVCEIGAKSTVVSALLPRALQTGHLRLVAEAVVKEISTDSRGTPDGVDYFDAAKRLVHQKARLIVLAASATETPRILLNSKSRWFPRGMANQHDWVGRNLMGHINPKVYGIFDWTTNEGYGPGTGIGIDDYYGRIPGLVGGGVIYSRSDIGPISFNNYRPDDAPMWGLSHKRYQRENYKRYYRLTAPAEDLPRFSNRVEVSPDVVDHWGIPVARITHAYHERDFELARFLERKMESILQEAGAREIYFNNLPKGGLTVHQNGTCRMGNDPKTSVVNRYGQCHGIDNVFVADASCFVTSGGRNPVLTVQAIAYWIAAYIAREWSRGGLR